jgi:filamentous hemagglutinin
VYVEQQVPEGNGGTTTALAPTVYLPELYRHALANTAGGVIQGDDVSINVSGTFNNTGYIVAKNHLSITAEEFINAKRQADFGKEYQGIADGWVDITGTKVQPGG